jgi:hypothetical protein
MRAVALVDDLIDASEADENVHNPFDLRPVAEEEVHDVQVHAEEPAESDETPVESADDDENRSGRTEGTHTFHHRMMGEEVEKKESGGKIQAADKKNIRYMQSRSHCAYKKL